MDAELSRLIAVARRSGRLREIAFQLLAESGTTEDVFYEALAKAVERVHPEREYRVTLTFRDGKVVGKDVFIGPTVVGQPVYLRDGFSSLVPTPTFLGYVAGCPRCGEDRCRCEAQGG